MTDPAASIAIRDLRFSYPDGTRVLDGVDLDVVAGERVAVLGPNGAGKTTLMLHLNGILRPESGTVAIDGTGVTPATARAIRQRVGLVFQDPDDQLFMPTIGEDVAFGPANYGLRGAGARAQSRAGARAGGADGCRRSAAAAPVARAATSGGDRDHPVDGCRRGRAG